MYFHPQLKALEASLPAGKRLCDVFDLIVATSTGAIMGAPIAAGGEMIDIENLYKSEGKWIFTPQNFMVTALEETNKTSI